jgi:FkbM family methyltransferase
MAGKLASQIKKLPRAWRAAHYCQDYLDHYNYYSYDFEVNGEKHLLTKLATLDPTIIFDVGCHTGSWTKAALQVIKTAKFHCFDIAQDSLIQADAGLGKSNAVILNLGAISDNDGTVKFRSFGPQSQLNTTLLESSWTEPGNPGEISIVKSIRGDTYCKDNGISSIDLLKLDCEGADHRALQGFSSMLKAEKIRVVQFEYGYTNGDSKYLMRDFFDFFQQHGYILAPLRPKKLKFDPWRYEFNDFKSGPNWIAVRSSDRAIINLLG